MSTVDISEPPWKKLKKRKVVNVAFVNRTTRQILLHKRIKEKYNGKEFWAFFWWKKEPGEEIITTAIREIEEELEWETPGTGLKLDNTDLIHVCHTEVQKASEIILREVFLVLTDKEERNFVTREKTGEDGVYFSFEDAKKLDFRNDISDELLKVEKMVNSLLWEISKSKKYPLLEAFRSAVLRRIQSLVIV